MAVYSPCPSTPQKHGTQATKFRFSLFIVLSGNIFMNQSVTSLSINRAEHSKHSQQCIRRKRFRKSGRGVRRDRLIRSLPVCHRVVREIRRCASRTRLAPAATPAKSRLLFFRHAARPRPTRPPRAFSLWTSHFPPRPAVVYQSTPAEAPCPFYGSLAPNAGVRVAWCCTRSWRECTRIWRKMFLGRG